MCTKQLLRHVCDKVKTIMQIVYPAVHNSTSLNPILIICLKSFYSFPIFITFAVDGGLS